jgi:replicative DNA helicase
MSVTPLRLEERAERLLPYNVEAEQALLGALLICNDAFDGVAGFLRAEDFGQAVHRRIYAAAARLISAGANANPVTLKNEFDADAALQQLGGQNTSSSSRDRRLPSPMPRTMRGS